MMTHAKGTSQALKRYEKTFSLQLRVILGTETAYNNKTDNKQKQQVLGKEEDLILRVTT